ncbi:hypothetical protein Q7P37_002702 [Cladosporium fusiforme]
MGSVVIDAVNSFFSQPPAHNHNHTHTHTHTQPAYCDPAPPRARTLSTSPNPPQRSRTPSRTTASSMSEKTPSASASQHVHQTDSLSTHTHERHSEKPPPSPGLGARAAPPGDAPVPGPPVAAQPSATDARPARRKIKVRDLEHIQSFASEDMGAFSEIRNRSRSRSRGADESPQYEISEMKVEHIIEMVAGLLTKITTTNDQQHEHLHRQPPSIDNALHLNPQTSSVVAFHGKNVPSITILSYLTRINKYCPTSYEVFLSLLVYFDRMTERVNAGPMQSLREANAQAFERNKSGRDASDTSDSSDEDDKMEDVVNTSASGGQTATPPASGGMEKTTQPGVPGTPHSKPQQPELAEAPAIDPYNLSHFFVVDSFNIHRLVIAGVTCASKFFSDIFYTNSRYAKVGGLPLQELNHLELQFLLLNDFRLSVPVEEIEAYGTMLVEFYAREVVAQQKAAEAMQARSLSESSEDSVSTVRAAG